MSTYPRIPCIAGLCAGTAEEEASLPSLPAIYDVTDILLTILKHSVAAAVPSVRTMAQLCLQTLFSPL